MPDCRIKSKLETSHTSLLILPLLSLSLFFSLSLFLSLSFTAVHLLTMATLVVLHTLPMAPPLLPLTTLTDPVPLLQEAVVTDVTLPIHHTPTVEVGVTMVGVAMAHPLLVVVVVVTMDDTNSTNNLKKW